MTALVTLFGGGGFLGRYVAQELLTRGVRVRIAQRDARAAWFIKPQGTLGQTHFVSTDICNPASVARALEGADAVVNLVGLLDGDLQRTHVDGARNVAQAAAAAGTDSLVHVSAIGADRNAAALYGRTKAAGESAVSEAYPDATIIRPSILFGQEDDFVNRFARMMMMAPFMPVIRPGTRFQPVFVTDVARAVALSVLDRLAHRGQTYELGGPQVLTMREIMDFIARATNRRPVMVELPDGVGRMLARAGGLLPGAPIRWDQWLMLQQDNVVSPGARGFEAFDIVPTPLAAVAPEWLVQYRRHGRFSRVGS